MSSKRRYLLLPLLALALATSASADTASVNILPEQGFNFSGAGGAVSAGWPLPGASMMIWYGGGSCGSWQFNSQLAAKGFSGIRMMPFEPNAVSGTTGSCGGFGPTLTFTDGTNGFGDTNGEVVAVPEPGTILLVGSGLVVCYIRRFRR